MTITKTTKTSLSLAVAIIILAVLYALSMARTSEAAAPAGLMSSVATTSNPTVTTTAAVVFATSTCASRIITTSAAPVMMTFSDYAGQTPTGSFGHLQAASTTVAYDAGVYGCGLVKVFSQGTQVITVTETR